MTCYLSTSYLPSIKYIATMLQYNEVCIEAYENYPKQTFRNRCRIASANGVQTLTVPVEKPDAIKCQTRDIRISDHGNWRHLHWNALVSAYNLSPFFEYYADDFRPFYEKKYKFLIDYNLELLLLICNLLDVSPIISFTNEYYHSPENDFRTCLTSRNPHYPDDEFKPYYQVFRQKQGFLPNLSVIDLLFNMGNESVFYF